MRIVFANLALLSGTIGFAGYLFLIISGALGCCTGMTAGTYQNVVLAILVVSVIFFIICMYNNCCRLSRKE